MGAALARILVVEDEALIADDIERTLRKLGYAVPAVAASAGEALSAVARHRPELVLMDIKLDGPSDGIDAAGRIRQDYDVPFIFLTSHSDDATLTRASSAHPHGYLLKPFTDRELRSAIEVALQRHALEARLASRERWFATTLQSIGDAVIATDAQDRVYFMNTEAERLTGWARDAAVGRRSWEVLRLREDPESRGPASDRALLATRTGETRLIEDSVAPIIDEHAELLGSVVVLRDVTERRRLEQRLALSERLAAIGTLAAGMTHEINNPLAYVVTNLGLAREDLDVAVSAVEGWSSSRPDPAEVAAVAGMLRSLDRALRDASEGADRVRRIVSDVRRFARADEANVGVVALHDTLEGAIRLTEHALRHHARLVRDYGTVPAVEGNEGQLIQVFTNLITNAADALKDGRASSNEVRITTRTSEDGSAVVEVRDTGPGIPKDVLPRIFDPFYTTKPVGRGMGLGLAIVHGIVTGMGGEIVAESAPKEGAVFRVTLPASRAEARAASEATRAVDAPAERRGRVLVIDDELALADSIARVLDDEHDVDVATSATDALESLVDGASYDAILCDVMMPNLSGVDFHEALTEVRPELAARVVFMTGGAFTDRARAFLAKVSNKQLAKPFEIDALRALIRSYVHPS